MIGSDKPLNRAELLRQEWELKQQIAVLEKVQPALKEPTPAPSAWTPDNPREDDPSKCKCGATTADPWCYCGC